MKSLLENTLPDSNPANDACQDSTAEVVQQSIFSKTESSDDKIFARAIKKKISSDDKIFKKSYLNNRIERRQVFVKNEDNNRIERW